MIEVKEKIHRIMAPRLTFLIGTVSEKGVKNIIPISNVTSISTEPGMVIMAVYVEWVTCANLRKAKGFTMSLPSKNQLELVWKLGPKYSGYNSGFEKDVEFKDSLDTNFSPYGPVLKGAIGWIECDIVDFPKDVGGNHLMVIGKYKKAMVDPKQYTSEITPIGNPKPIMQWERNNFSTAADIFSIEYFKDPGF